MNTGAVSQGHGGRAITIADQPVDAIEVDHFRAADADKCSREPRFELAQRVVDEMAPARRYGDDEIERYLAAERPYDCTGSAKIEGIGIVLIESVESADPTALVGLPLIALAGMLVMTWNMAKTLLAGKPADAPIPAAVAHA